MRRHQGKKPKHWSKESPPGPWDYIVVGSGMGGLTAAALLSTLGRRVLVLEQHYVPGGFTHTFKRKGYLFDVGVHAVGEVTRHTMVGRLLSRISEGQLRWSSLGGVYEQFHFPGDFRIEFPDNPQQFRANLVEAFPKEAPGIDRYLDQVRDVARAMRNYYLARLFPTSLSPLLERTLARRAQRHLQLNTRRVISGLTEDEKLRAVLCAQWGYYGSPPDRSSFAMQALVAKHFLYGGYYPEGGSAEIARTLTAQVERAGGWTRVGASVDRIILEGGRAVGVQLASGDMLRAKAVISAAGVRATVERMLPPDVRSTRWARAVASLPPAPAHVCMYLGFKGDIRQAGASGANKWFYETWDDSLETWAVDPQNSKLPDAPVLYTSFPSLKDPLHDPGPDQRHTGEVVTFVPWQTFQQWQHQPWMKRDGAYESLKKRLQEKMLKQLLHHMPKLEPMIDLIEFSTPLSTDHFVRPVRGSIYGLEPTPRRFATPWLRPRSPIPGLLFAGSEVTTVGVIGAMMGGVLAAAVAEPIASFELLRGVMR